MNRPPCLCQRSPHVERHTVHACFKTRSNENCIFQHINMQFWWHFTDDGAHVKLSLKIQFLVFLYSHCCELGADEKTV